MESFNIGDCVRVLDSVLGSEFVGRVGIVVAIERRRTAAAMQIVECVVEFDEKVRRRFVGFQLKLVERSAHSNSWSE
jgi:hypothetical protein